MGEVEGAFRDAGIPVTTVHAEHREAAAVELAQCLRSGARAVIAAGGDGTVHLVANVLADEGARTSPTLVPPLGIVPVGTGNDLARCFGISPRPGQAAASVIAALREGKSPRALDALRVDSGWGHRWVLGVLAAGFDAVVNERANGIRRPRGRLRYDLALLRELPGLRARRYLIDRPGHPAEHRTALLLAVANVASYGGGIRISPDSDPDDGCAELVSVARIGPVQIARLLPLAYRGRHLAHPAVSVDSVTHLRLATASGGKERIVAYGDGERLGPLPVTITVVPGAVSLLA